MKPVNKIKKAILLRIKNDVVKQTNIIFKELENDRDVSLFYEFIEESECSDLLQDARSEFRQGEQETEIECDWSRHYESKSVAAEMDDGSWVGWTYWYGGGKHGEPEAGDWMEDSYDLGFIEETKIVKIFSKK